MSGSLACHADSLRMRIEQKTKRLLVYWVLAPIDKQLLVMEEIEGSDTKTRAPERCIRDEEDIPFLCSSPEVFY